MPSPISAALLAHYDLAPLLPFYTSPMGDPLAARFCDSVSKDCLWAPIFVEDCRFCAWARTALNSAVRSCIEVVVIFEQRTRAAAKSVLYYFSILAAWKICRFRRVMKHPKAEERGGAEGQVVRRKRVMFVVGIGRKENG